LVLVIECIERSERLNKALVLVMECIERSEQGAQIKRKGIRLKS
jgi:hypothetical protein